MQFANAYMGGIVMMILLMVGIWNWRKWRRKEVCAVRIPVLEELMEAERKAGFWSRERGVFWLERFLLGVAILLLTVALMRPQVVNESKKVSKNGVDIVIALDVSESMLAEDLKPNRIEAAKEYIADFVEELEGDRVGLLVFAGKPFTQSPLSFDYEVVGYYLDEISTKTIDQQRRGLSGTAIGDAIVAAINRFQNEEERTKVMILLTDGETTVGTEPIFAAEHARAQGIKIYTIGLGKKEGAPLPIGERNGQKIYARNYDGSLALTKFDEETLKNIAKVADGKYFYAGKNSTLQKSLETINQLEKQEYEAETTTTYEDWFWWFVFWGFVCVIGSVLIRLKMIINSKL